MIGALQPEEGAAVVKEITADGGEALVAAAEHRWGRLDVLYASAGVQPAGTAPETSEDAYQLAVESPSAGASSWPSTGSRPSPGPAAGQ